MSTPEETEADYDVLRSDVSDLIESCRELTTPEASGLRNGDALVSALQAFEGAAIAREAVTEQLWAFYSAEFSPDPDLRTEEYESLIEQTVVRERGLERFASNSPFHTRGAARGEGFNLIVEDLLILTTTTRVLVEGFRLLPRLVAPLLGERPNAVWLLPSPEFRRAAITHRGSINEIPGRTSDPALALDNLRQRDAMFTDQLRSETALLDLASIDVDVPETEDGLVDEVAALFGLVP